jgi:hypothetical protein
MRTPPGMDGGSVAAGQQLRALMAALDEWRKQEKDVPHARKQRSMIAQSLKASGRIGTAAPSTKPRK